MIGSYSRTILESFFLANIEGAEKVSNGVSRGRCPVCGDSKKSKKKKRFYLLSENTPVVIFCHNCSFCRPAHLFFKEQFPDRWKYVQTRSFMDGTLKQEVKESKKKRKEEDWRVKRDYFLSERCFPLKDEPESIIKRDLWESATDFVKQRKIPENCYNEFYVCFEGKHARRVIIPFFDEKGEVYHFQSRALPGLHIEPSYLTGSFRSIEGPILYRWHRVDKSREVFIFEGLLDSLYFENAVALCGVSKTKAIERVESELCKFTFVLDNDTAGKKHTKRLLKEGYNCFVWPQELPEEKDFGEMVEDEMELSEEFINRNTFSGLEGLVRMR